MTSYLTLTGTFCGPTTPTARHLTQPQRNPIEVPTANAVGPTPSTAESSLSPSRRAKSGTPASNGPLFHPHRFRFTRMPRSKVLVRSVTATLVFVGALMGFQTTAAEAHPLGNFTTNIALHLTVEPGKVTGNYTVDFAEIPALQIRQKLGLSRERAADAPSRATVASWSKTTCRDSAARDELKVDNRPTPWTADEAFAEFLPGQAGLTTLRLSCEWRAAVTSPRLIEVSDENFDDRLGWREISAIGRGVALATELPNASPTNALRSYPVGAIGSPTNVRTGRIGVNRETNRAVQTEGSSRASGTNAAQGTGGDLRSIQATSPTDRSTSNAVGTTLGASNVAASNFDSSNPGASNVAASNLAIVASRGNDGLTNRFQSLVARDRLTPLFAIGAALLAMLLGGFHALAPGHGKSLMAAYVIGRHGGARKELATIGLTVALTHTIGVVVLGLAALTSTTFSPDRTFKFAGVVSGLLVIMVGMGLLRTRLRAYRVAMALDGSTPWWNKPRTNHTNRLQQHDHQIDHHTHPHPHPHHNHPQSHDHAVDPQHDHAHAHAHSHGHQHHNEHSARPRRLWSWLRGIAQFRKSRLDQARKDPKFVVTEHAHGGTNHTHVLPAPGAKVSRRQLVSMGFAGGLVPSPSALVVLLAAVALERVWFGVILVVAYGIGLALTLIGAGLTLVYFEGRMQRWSATGGHSQALVPVLRALPIASAFVLVGGGALLITRALGSA